MTESKSVIALGVGREGDITKGYTEETLGVLNMFIILIVLMV